MLLCSYCRVLVPYTIKSEKRTTSYNVTYIRNYGECDICHKEIMVPGLDDENSRTLDAEIEKIRRRINVTNSFSNIKYG